MRIFIFGISALLSAMAWAVPAKNLGPKSGKALDLLARGGAVTVYTDSIRADVSNLNCNVDRMSSTKGKANATTCSGMAGKKNLQLTGEKAAEMYKLLETVTVAQSFPAADSIEVKKMSCRFNRQAGAQCVVVK
jgi:hypothetical protein